jgi:GntR family transcriptional regulator
MRLWLSKNSAASLRDQLVTQLRLGVNSGDLRPGEKLASVREIARRYQIHSNTVSAAYRDLARGGWLEFRKGSGVYVLGPEQAPERSTLDELIQQFLGETRARGFSTAEVRARLTAALGGGPVRRLVVAGPEPELCEILVAELRGRVPVPVSGVMLDGRFPQATLKGAAVTALLGWARELRAALPAGVPYHLLRLRSLPESLAGEQRPAPNVLIDVASSSAIVLRRVRTILSAAGLDPDALEFRDAREKGWKAGLHLCTFVIADAVTARKLPAKCTARVIQVLSTASVEELRGFLELVTDRKVS